MRLPGLRWCLLAAAIVLVISSLVGAQYTLSARFRRWGLSVEQASLVVRWAPHPEARWYEPEGWVESNAVKALVPVGRPVFWLVVVDLSPDDVAGIRMVGVGLVPFAAATSILAVYLLGRHRGRTFRAGRRCPSCGYSFEGLAGGAICPECGAAGSRASGGAKVSCVRRAVRRVWSRGFMVPLAAVLLGVMLVGAYWNLSARVRGRWSVSLEQGEVLVRWAGDPAVRWPEPQGLVDVAAGRSNSPGLALRWRPVHLAFNSWPKSSPFHTVAVPLWHAAFGVLCAAAWLAGVARGRG